VRSGGVLWLFVTSERATVYLASYDVVGPDVDTAETGPAEVWWGMNEHSLRAHFRSCVPVGIPTCTPGALLESRPVASRALGIATCRLPRSRLRLLADARDQVLDEVVLQAIFADALGDPAHGV
jgi:hypothetical protein